MQEVVSIKLAVHSKEEDILTFLAKLNGILQDPEFNIDKDLTVIRSRKTKDKEKFSTVYTLLDLDYDSTDIVNRLKELTVSDYSETLVDIDDQNPPLLFVFGKDINGKQVYIKLKLKGDRARHVLCVSFHYAEVPMKFPYRR